MMRRGMGPIIFCLFFWSCFISFAAAADLPVTDRSGPAEHARALTAAQDQVAAGDAAALQSIPELRMQLARSIDRADVSTWSDAKDVRALAVYLISGGPPQRVRRKVDSKVDLGRSSQLILALLAYAERKTDAGEKLAAIDARLVDHEIGGHFALIQAIAHAGNPDKAKPYLAQAKLLAPGGIVEDAAWRREINIHLEASKPELAAHAATRYLWRFGASVYARDVVDFLAASVVPELPGSAEGRAALAALIAQIGADTRAGVLIRAAASALVRGKVRSCAYVANMAAAIAVAGTPERLRAEFYAAVAQAFIDPSEASADKLREIGGNVVSDEDRRLLQASIAVLERVRAPLKSHSVAGEAGNPAALEAAAKAIRNAQQLLDQSSS